MKYAAKYQHQRRAGSLPVRGAWIEIATVTFCPVAIASLPVRGAWIEISA